MSSIKPCVVAVADAKYLPHAKSLLVNCKRQGKWKGDYCLVLSPDCDKQEYESRGIKVFHDPEPTYYKKFAIFDPFFDQWDMMVYLDCDVMVQAPLEPLLHEVPWGGILADNEPFDLEHAFTHWADEEDSKTPESVELFEWLWEKCDKHSFQFNTGILVWHPRTFIPDARKKLHEMREKIRPINTHCDGGTEQPVANIVLYGRFRQVRSCLFSYWYSACENTIVIHYCSAYGPWIKRASNMDAYMNDKLGRPCNDVYKENLSLFDETFPKP